MAKQVVSSATFQRNVSVFVSTRVFLGDVIFREVLKRATNLFPCNEARRVYIFAIYSNNRHTTQNIILTTLMPTCLCVAAKGHEMFCSFVWCKLSENIATFTNSPGIRLNPLYVYIYTHPVSRSKVVSPYAQ